MELHQLRCFVAVAEELHFGRAATRLNMTQPPLSRQIQLLEHALRVSLFTRNSRNVHLTPAGQVFLADARKLLRLSEAATQHARRIAAGQAGRLRIGFTAASAYRFLPTLITALRARLPGVDLILEEMVSGEQFEAFASGQIDAGLLRPPITQPGVASLQVDAEPLLVALPGRHPLARQTRLSLDDLDGQDFVMYDAHGSKYFHDLLVMLFTAANVQPHIVQQLGQIHSMLSLVRAGLGVALVPAAAAALRYHDVRFRPLDLARPTSVELFLAWRTVGENPLLSDLIEVARGCASINPN
jgi:DNA-binding transcriptional LysR family regulator